MIKSPYATQFTREQVAGKRNPSRDMTNYKAKQKPQRTAAWHKRQAAAANA
jgi:hypothetical protein